MKSEIVSAFQAPADFFEYGLAKTIGIIFILLLAVFVIYVGTWQAAYAKTFYSVKFKINFLEGVQPGMKIRYQGGVIIGEVENIESDYRTHYLNAKIKKDFKIIKSGTKISIKEQGSFGGSYIDISTLPYYFDSTPYSSDDIINIEEIVPLQSVLSNFSIMLHEDARSNSLLNQRVADLESMVFNITTNKDFFPENINRSLRMTYSSVAAAFTHFARFNQELYEQVSKLDKTLNTTSNTLRTNIPVFRKKINSFYEYIDYKWSDNSRGQFLHDEQAYNDLLFRMKHIDQLIATYKKYPFKIIFESGL